MSVPRPQSPVRLLRGAGSGLHALVSPSTYVHAGTELLRSAVVLATYPCGLVPRVTETIARMEQPSPLLEELPRYPVVLAHGWYGNKSNFLYLSRSLRSAGFDVSTFSHVPFRSSVDEISRRLESEVYRAMARTGSDRVHLVGHSMGGVLIRYACTELGLAGVVAGAVTLGSPHGGSPLGRLPGGGRVASELAVGSRLLSALEERSARAAGPSWLGVAGTADKVVPAARALIRPEVLAARNVTFRGVGHLGLTLDPRVSALVLETFRVSEAAGVLGPLPIPAQRRPASATARL